MYSGQGNSGKLTLGSRTGAKDHDHVCVAPLQLILHILSLQGTIEKTFICAEHWSS